MSKTLEEVKAEHAEAVQREAEASRCWQMLALAARDANARAEEAYAAWNEAAEARNAAFEEMYAVTKAATAPPRGDA